MPRPKRILWVDDEVESLTSHTLFLEEQGFLVDKASHGDDASAKHIVMEEVSSLHMPHH